MRNGQDLKKSRPERFLVMHGNTSEPLKLKAVPLPEFKKCGRVIPRHVVRTVGERISVEKVFHNHIDVPGIWNGDC